MASVPATDTSRFLWGPSIGAIGLDPTLRAARPDDCRRIAELFRIASEGVADYVWSLLVPEYPGLSLLRIGEQRYRREGTPFSYQNCTLAEKAGEVIGMVHAFPIAAADPDAARDEADDDVDPVLRPYADLEAPGSLYIAALALLPGHRRQGQGTRLLNHAREQARRQGIHQLSLLCFASNSDALRLYWRQGFFVVGRRPIVPHPLIHANGDVLLMTAAA